MIDALVFANSVGFGSVNVLRTRTKTSQRCASILRIKIWDSSLCKCNPPHPPYPPSLPPLPLVPIYFFFIDS